VVALEPSVWGADSMQDDQGSGAADLNWLAGGSAEGSGAKGAPHPFTDQELHAVGLDDPGVRAWMGKHLPELRRSAYGQRLLYQSLGIAFVIGLAAHVGGYLLKSSVTTELLGLVADLLYSLGFALWTGVVVVVFAEVIPEVKRRQIKRTLDAYEATLREKARAASDQAPGGDEAPTAR
jgi:hypothetical protein